MGMIARALMFICGLVVSTYLIVNDHPVFGGIIIFIVACLSYEKSSKTDDDSKTTIK